MMTWCSILIIFILPISNFELSASQSVCSILNYNVSEHNGNLFLKWQSDCQFVSVYKVYATLVKLKACENKNAVVDITAGQFQVGETNSPLLSLSHLRSYADYQVEILAVLPQNGNVSQIFNVTTPDGVPGTVPKGISEPKTFTQSVRYSWQAPDDCTRQNGEMDGFHVRILGVDPWVSDKKPVFEKTIDLDFLYVDDLLPFTQYKLQVFSRNSNGLWNPNRPLEKLIRTEATKPKPPTDIKLQSEINAVHLQWLPSYPKTGEVDKYVIRVGSWRKNETENWQRRYEVPTNQDWCGHSLIPRQVDAVCWIVNELKPNTKYYFSIRTFNRNVSESSIFSNTVFTKTKEDPSLLMTTTSESPTNIFNNTSSRTPRANSSTSSENPGQNTQQTLIVVLTLGVGIILVLMIIGVLFYKIKEKQLKIRYETQRRNSSVNFDSNRFSANSTCYTSGMSSITNMTWTNSASQFNSLNVEEIQNRRLPEPPPDKNVIQMQNRNEDSNLYHEAEVSHSQESAKYMDVSNDQLSRPDSIDGIDGYLKPTFQLQSLGTHHDNQPSVPTCSTPNPIPAESYDCPRNLMDQIRDELRTVDFGDISMCSGVSSNQSNNPPKPSVTESQPLILPNVVHI